MEIAEPDVDGYLIKLDDLSLEEILQSQDTVLADALRRLKASAIDPGDTVSAFNNFI